MVILIHTWGGGWPFIAATLPWRKPLRTCKDLSLKKRDCFYFHKLALDLHQHRIFLQVLATLQCALSINSDKTEANAFEKTGIPVQQCHSCCWENEEGIAWRSCTIRESLKVPLVLANADQHVPQLIRTVQWFEQSSFNAVRNGDRYIKTATWVSLPRERQTAVQCLHWLQLAKRCFALPSWFPNVLETIKIPA